MNINLKLMQETFLYLIMLSDPQPGKPLAGTNRRISLIALEVLKFILHTSLNKYVFFNYVWFGLFVY
jgi:hypothetical protein